VTPPVEDDTEDMKTLNVQIGSFSDYQERIPTPVPSEDEVEEVAVDYFQAKIMRQARKQAGGAAVASRSPFLESSDSGSEPGRMLELRKAKRVATKGTYPVRSTSVDTNQGRAGGLGTVGGAGKTDTRMARSRPSKT
jgi:hypothetical protein